MIYGYSYKTVNLVNNRIYIGQKKGAFTQWYLGSGKALKNAIRKYGKNCFKVILLEYANSKVELDQIEINTIKYYKSLKCDMYNIADGGNNQPHLYQTGRTRFKNGSIPWNKGLHICLNTGRTHLKKGETVGIRFKKGHVPWAKKVAGKGILKANSGSFKKGVLLSNEIINKRNETNRLRLLEKCQKTFL